MSCWFLNQKGYVRQTLGLIMAEGVILALLALLASCFAAEGLALPIWPLGTGPNGQPVSEDRIGYEDGSSQEFGDYTLDPNALVITWQVGVDSWASFPRRLNTKHNSPHTVHILFDTASIETSAAWKAASKSAWSLTLAARSDAPQSQRLGVWFDGQPTHPPAGEEIRPGASFQPHTFWLGYITPGQHRITLSNQTDPNTQNGVNYGIFFDYLKLVPGAKVGLFLAPETQANIVLADFTPLAQTDPAIAGSRPPRANFYAGYWKFKLSGLEPGGWVKIEIRCPREPFFPLQSYYSYSSGAGQGSEGSGWRPLELSLDQSRATATVKLSDGGEGDSDATPDGVISHLGGLAAPLTLGESYNYQGCFITSLMRLRRDEAAFAGYGLGEHNLWFLRKDN